MAFEGFRGSNSGGAGTSTTRERCITSSVTIRGCGGPRLIVSGRSCRRSRLGRSRSWRISYLILLMTFVSFICTNSRGSSTPDECCIAPCMTTRGCGGPRLIVSGRSCRRSRLGCSRSWSISYLILLMTFVSFICTNSRGSSTPDECCIAPCMTIRGCGGPRLIVSGRSCRRSRLGRGRSWCVSYLILLMAFVSFICTNSRGPCAPDECCITPCMISRSTVRRLSTSKGKRSIAKRFN
jgi:uncharacterized protein YodC (DUF2158 family)